MNEILLSLITVPLCSTIILLLLPKSRLSQAIKILCSLLIIVTIVNAILPFTSILFDLNFSIDVPEIDDGDSKFNEDLINKTGLQICVYTKEMLHTRFAIPIDAIQVSATLQSDKDGTVYIKSITVKLLENINVDKYLIADAVSDTLMCECTVLIPE